MPRNFSLDKIFKALGDAKRREIFHLLMVSTSALTLSQLAGEFEISRQGVTKHIELLKDAGLINVENKGRQKFCKIDPKPLSEIKNWLAYYDQFWDNKLTNLSDFLDASS